MKVHRKFTKAIFAATLLCIAFSCEKIDPIPTPDTPADNQQDNQQNDQNQESKTYNAPENKEFRRIAYFPSYRSVGESYVPDFIYQSIDIAYYAFASINSNYGVDLQAPSVLRALVTRAHNMGVKVVLSFNGSSSTFVNMTSTAAGRQKFFKAVMAIVNEYDLDGVDNDWEYPSTKNGSDKGNLELMRLFSNNLHAPGVNKLLTMAITSGKYAGSYRDAILDELFDCVDWFNVMIYDDFSTSVPGINHSSYEFFLTSYDYFINKRKLPKYKFVAGLPVYGRPSGITQSGTTKSYASILKQGGDPDADEAIVSSDSYAGGPYTIYYNGRPTIRKKVDFVIDKQLGGYFFWEQGQDSYDDRSLIKTASDQVNIKKSI